MTERNQTGLTRCPDECSLCPAAEGDNGSAPEAPTLQGWRLVLSAMGVFGLPIVLAVAGAVLAWGGPAGQWLGAVTGFVVGTAIAAVGARRLYPGRKERA